MPVCGRQRATHLWGLTVQLCNSLHSHFSGLRFLWVLSPHKDSSQESLLLFCTQPLIQTRQRQFAQYKVEELLSVCERKKKKKSAFWAQMSLTSPRVRVQLERLSHPTRVINVASQQGSGCSACVVYVCVWVSVCVCNSVFNNRPCWRRRVVRP